MKVIEVLTTELNKRFPEYAAAKERVQKADEAFAAAQLERQAAREHASSFGETAHELEQIIYNAKRLFGESE